MSSDNSDMSAYIKSRGISEQSPMRSNYLTYYKTGSKSGNRIPKSPSDVETRHFEERGITRKRPCSNFHKLVPRKSESDLCFGDIKKQNKRSHLTTTLLNSTHEGWDCGRSLGAYGASVPSSDKILQQKQTASLKRTQEHDTSSILDTWNNHKTNCSLTTTSGADSELHKTSTHFERLFGDRNNVHEFSALNAALPSRKLFFMQEYPSKLSSFDAKQATAETAGCNKRRSYIETSRNLFGFGHKFPTRDKCAFPDTCDGRYEISTRPPERPYTGAIEHDHEIYASYISDHCRKNRRGRNSNKNSNLLPESKLGVDSELNLHGLRSDNPKRGLTSFDSRTVSDLPSEYPTSDQEVLDNSNFSHFPVQTEINFNSYLNDKKKVKKARNNTEKNAVVVNKHDRSCRCTCQVDSDDVVYSSPSNSDNISLSGKRRTKKKRQRTGAKKSPCSKQNMHEEETKKRVSKHYNEHRRHASKDLNKGVSRSDHLAKETEQNHGLDSNTRRIFAGPENPDVLAKDEHFQPKWTCTKWAKDSRNKNTQDSSNWAYEVYSDTCLNSTMNGLSRGFRTTGDNVEDSHDYDMADTDLLDPDLESLDYNQQVLCAASFPNPTSAEPRKLNRCDAGYCDVPNFKMKPFLVANHNPLIMANSERVGSKLIEAVWTQHMKSQTYSSNTDNTDEKISSSQNYQHGQRMPAENKTKTTAEEKYHSQEKSTTTESCNLGRYEKKVLIKKSKHETYLDQTYSNCTKHKHTKCLQQQSVERGAEVAGSACTSMKNISVDENLIRTVYSIKEDIESVFARLNSLDMNKGDNIVKSALSLKESLQDLLGQTKAVDKNKISNVVSAAEVVKKTLKTLTTFKTAFAKGKMADDDSRDMSYELYKIGKEEYNAGSEAGSNQHNIHIVSIDSSRKPYYRLTGRSNATSSDENSLIETDVTSCTTLCPESASDSCARGTMMSQYGNGDRRKHVRRKSQSKQNMMERDKSVVSETILKELARSSEKTPFSSAASTVSHKSNGNSFDQKFEEMLARFPADEFEIAGIPESLTRGRSPCSTKSKSKKKRKSPHSKRRKSPSNKQQRERSVAGSKPSLTSTKGKHGVNSARDLSRERDKVKSNPGLRVPSRTGVMMQPHVNKIKSSEDILIEPLISVFAPCDITDKSEVTEEIPAKKYREIMLQPRAEIDCEESNKKDNDFLKESLKSWRGSHEYPVSTRDIKIIYKMRSKTMLTEDEKSYINSICMQKTEEEIMTVPYDNENAFPSNKKGNSDIPSTENSPDSDNDSNGQLWSSNSGREYEIEESAGDVKGIIMPSEGSKYGPANVLLGHDPQRNAGISKDIHRNETNGFTSSQSLKDDILAVASADANVFKENYATKKIKATKPGEISVMPTAVCKISDLSGEVTGGSDLNRERTIESVDTLESTRKDVEETKHNTPFDTQSLVCSDRSVSTCYKKIRETTDLLLPNSATQMNYQTDDIQQSETREKEINKATHNENADVLDSNTVALLNASIMKLYEEVNKLRVKLDNSVEKSSQCSSPKDEPSRSRADSKKNTSAKDSNLKPIKSTTSTQSSRAIYCGCNKPFDEEDSSSKRGRYFETTSLDMDLQSMVSETMSGIDLTSVDKYKVGKLCCVFRKYDNSYPETIDEYYDRISKSGEQESHGASEVCYLEYADQSMSPALYIEHKSPNLSPAIYMEEEADDSSVASYAEETIGQDTTGCNSNVQYFEKNMSRRMPRENSPENGRQSCDNYWSGFKTMFPGKPAVLEDLDSQYEERRRCGVIKNDGLDPVEPNDVNFLGVPSSGGNVHEYLARGKHPIFSETIVEYTSNTITAENIGQQLNQIAAKMNSVSAQLDDHLRNACSKISLTPDPEDGFGNWEQQRLESDPRIDCDVGCVRGVLSVDGETKSNSEMATDNSQHCSVGNQNISEVNLDKSEGIKTELPSLLETSIGIDMEKRSNVPSSVSDNTSFEVICKVNSNRSEAYNSPRSCSNKQMPNASTENLQQSSKEEISDQEDELIKQRTPPMWSDSEESDGKKEEDYIASLQIPRIVKCVRDMFFGSTKAQSKDAGHKSPNSYDWPLGASSSCIGNSSNNLEIPTCLSRCQTAGSDRVGGVINGYRNTNHKQSFQENSKENDADVVSSPLQQNYIIRKKDSRVNHGRQASPSMESLKKMSFEAGEINENSPHYRECSWNGKDISNYNFVGGNILLTSQPFVHYRPVGYLTAMKHVEETDKTVRHYCDAINTNAGKRLTSLETRCIKSQTTANNEESCCARMYGCRSELAHESEVIRDYDRSPFVESSHVSGHNAWTSHQCSGCPEWQSQMAPSSLFTRYQGNDSLPNYESTIQQRRPCYVEHCGFRQKRCDNYEHNLCTDEHALLDEVKTDSVGGGVNKGKCFGVNGNNSSHEVSREKDDDIVQGRKEPVKHGETLRNSTDMFYANEGMMDTIPYECSKKLDSAPNKYKFTVRDVSETNLYKTCGNVRSVDYENEGQMKHYKQEPRDDQEIHTKDDVEKSQTIYEKEVEESGRVVDNDGEGRVSVSDGESIDNDAESDEESMEDDEREIWYKTTDDESNS